MTLTRKISQIPNAASAFGGTERFEMVQGGLTVYGTISQFLTYLSSNGLTFSGGNVGIGLTNPSEKLDVRGTGNFNAVGGTYVQFQHNGTNVGYVATANAVLTGGATTNFALVGSNNLVFGIGATERARITAGGEFAVNNTNPAGFNAQFLSVSTSASKYAGVFYGNASSNDGQAAVQVAKSSNTNTSSQVFVDFYVDAFNAASGRIVANGASNAAFAAFSDERLKENITDLPSQLDNILALRPVEFDFKDGSGHQIGFIAQEVREVYPDVVTGNDDEMLTLVGWSKTEARLVKALQEAVAKIEALEARLEALEG